MTVLKHVGTQYRDRDVISCQWFNFGRISGNYGIFKHSYTCFPCAKQWSAMLRWRVCLFSSFSLPGETEHLFCYNFGSFSSFFIWQSVRVLFITSTQSQHPLVRCKKRSVLNPLYKQFQHIPFYDVDVMKKMPSLHKNY